MKKIAAILAALMCLAAITAFAELPAPGAPGSINDPRYCGEPARDASGVIKRSRKVLNEFTAVFPCPATLLNTPSCDAWAINHTIPLASGGCDSAANLTWMPDAIKSCADAHCEDRWERKYHAMPRQAIVLPAQAVAP